MEKSESLDSVCSREAAPQYQVYTCGTQVGENRQLCLKCHPDKNDTEKREGAKKGAKKGAKDGAKKGKGEEKNGTATFQRTDENYLQHRERVRVEFLSHIA